MQIAAMKEVLKVNALAGMKQSAIQHPEADRSLFIAAMTELQDELPIVSSWRTLRQSYISQTRTRCVCYYIPQALLKGDAL